MRTTIVTTCSQTPWFLTVSLTLCWRSWWGLRPLIQNGKTRIRLRSGWVVT